VRIALFKVFEEELFRHIGELAVIDQILHQFRAIAVERVETLSLMPSNSSGATLNSSQSSG
jgi:hypothetical protein